MKKEIEVLPSNIIKAELHRKGLKVKGIINTTETLWRRVFRIVI